MVSFLLSFTPNALAAPEAEIINTYGYLNNAGEYVVIGEVRNSGTTHLHFVEVVVSFSDENEEQIQQLSVSTALETLRPGQVSPFMVALKNQEDAANVASYTVRIGNIAPSEPKDGRLTVIFHSLEIVDNDIIISGRIANDGSSTSTNTKAFIILYSFTGEPVRFASVFTEPRNILAFGSALFSARIQVDDPSRIAGYAITSESSPYSETQRLVDIQDTQLERTREVIRISELVTLDMNGRPTSSVGVGQPVLVRVDLTNQISETSEYTYILQILDENSYVTSLSWSTGTVGPNSNVAPSIAWVPMERGLYLLQVFVWKSIDEPVPLSFRTTGTNIQIV